VLRPDTGGFFAPFSIALKLTFRFHGNMTMSSVAVRARAAPEGEAVRDEVDQWREDLAGL